MSWIFQIFFLVTFRSLIHLEFLIILCKILLSYCMLVSTAPFSWWIKWLFLSQNTFLNICDLIFIFSSLSHWSIYVFLEQHYTYTSYTYNLLFLASLQLGRALWLIQASLVAQWVRNPPAMCNLGSIPGWGRSPGEANGNPLQYSGLQSSMDCIVRGVTRSQTRLSDFHYTITTMSSIQSSLFHKEANHRASLVAQW